MHSHTIVSSVYKPNKDEESEKVFGANDLAHPAVHYLNNSVKEFYVGGSVQAINQPEHYDYVELRCTFIPALTGRLETNELSFSKQTLPLNSVLTSTSSHGPVSSLSKPETPCTALTENLPFVPLVNNTPTFSFTPS